MKKFAFLCVMTSVLAFVQRTLALPASARLYQQTYGYKVSCILCHTNGGGSAVNRYGKIFLRAGATATAFKKIESGDADDDGIPSLNEILAKSNPGDKLSVPTKVGDWLANAGSVFIPQKELEKIFPGFTKFSAIEGSLNPTQIEFLAAKSGGTVVDDDKVPTFYFAEKDGRRVAVGQLMATKSGDGKTLNAGVAVATNGKVMRVEILGGSEGKDAEGQANFLKSLEGKSLGEIILVKPSNAVASMVTTGAVRSLVLMQAVFGGAK